MNHKFELKNAGTRSIVAAVLMTLCLMILFMMKADAQLSNYCFTATTGTYAYNSGGTSVSGIQADDVNVTSVPIGFTFTYMGTGYTVASVSSNGWLSFVNGSPSAANSRTNTMATTNANLLKTLYPLWDDLNGSSGTATYLLTGSSPNRVFTMEWKNWKWDWQASGNTVSFQVKLYETTDIIEYWYKQESGSVNNGSSGASIGLNDATGGSTHYLSLNGTGATPTANTSTATDNLSTRPASNQIYRFTPWAISTQPTTQSICLGSSVTFSVAYKGTGTPTFQWKKGASNISGATSSTYNIPSVAAGDAATYTVVITYTCGSLTSTGAVLTVNTAPTAAAGTAVSTCSNSGAAAITASASAANNAGINWTSNGTGTFANATSLTTATYNPSAADIAAGTVTLTLTATANTGCTNATSTKAFNITAAPSAISGTVIGTCSSTGAVNITAGSSAANNAGITWTSNGTGTFANATSLTNATYTPSAADITAGSRTLTLTATGNGTCANATSAKNITITTAASANAGTVIGTCSTTGAVNITAGSSAANNAGIAWTSNGTGTF